MEQGCPVSLPECHTHYCCLCIYHFYLLLVCFICVFINLFISIIIEIMLVILHNKQVAFTFTNKSDPGGLG